MLSTDPLDFRLDADGDLAVGSGGFEIVSGIDGVAQLCVIAIKLFLAEWFLNQDKGMPWFQEILSQKFDQALVVLRASDVLAAVPGVVQVVSVAASFDPIPRRIDLNGVVRTEFGDAIVTTSVGGPSV